MEGLGCKLRVKSTTPESPSWWETAFVALPDVLKKGDRFLLGEVHSMPSKPEETHWVLKLEIAPGPTPPNELVEVSRQLGGYPGILRRIVDNWPTERRIDAETKVTLLLEEKKWRSPFAPKKRMALKPLSSGDHRATLSFESYAWDVAPSGILKKVTDLGYIGEAKELFGLSCSGEETLELTPEMLSRVEVALWHTVRGFLMKPSRRLRSKM
jgi:hypothetical protein